MGDIRVSQGIVAAAATSSTVLRASQAYTLATYRFLSPYIRASQSEVTIAGKADMDIRVSQTTVMVAWRGATENLHLRAWTFSMDGHDFYVLRLGDTSTVVYDVYSQQWMDWSDFDSLVWRAQHGINWFGGKGLANTYGSDVVAGDDTLGLIWFFDPKQPYDENPDAEGENLYFERVFMGQVPMVGREVLPCYAVWLTTDMGDPAYMGAGVRLEISDDAGKTFDDMGLVTITPNENRPELAWYSLGQIEAPGRLFRITDDGAFTRVDGMEMNDPDDDGEK